MKTMWCSIATLVLAALLSSVLGVAIADDGDKKLTESLVARSPWAGTFGYNESGPEAGTFTMSFSIKDGKLAGEMTSFSGQGTAQIGPVDDVELEDGKLYYVTPSNGVQNEFRFKEGKWRGSWWGRAMGWLSMSPTKP